MTQASTESDLVGRVREGEARHLYLISGEPVLSEAAGRRLGEALAAAARAELHVHRRPTDLVEILSDLRTFSMFESAKVTLVVESGVLSDQKAAAYLLDQAAEGLPIEPDEPLVGGSRQAAGRLLQVCRLFHLDPAGKPPPLVLEDLPAWVFEGGAAPGAKGRRKRRTKSAANELKDQLATLLTAAGEQGLEGWAESDATDLAVVAEEGLPAGHALVLCEAAASPSHPVVERLQRDGAYLELAHLEADRRGRWQGLRQIAEEMERATSCRIAQDALNELARRTLRHRSRRGAEGIDPDSSARFAAEYRKLASITEGRTIEVDLVRTEVEDRGEEDIWALLDAIGAGRSGEALDRLRRLQASADDPVATRLAFFTQLALFCRTLVAVSGMMEVTGVPAGERSYNRFKDRYASKLQGALPGSEFEPIGALHPFRLHRAYLSAGRMSRQALAGLPALVLDTEMRLKGESTDPEAALSGFVAWLAKGA